MMLRVSDEQYRKLNREPRRTRPPYIARRTDRNQPEIVKAFRKHGFMVLHLHEVGKGVFDLMVAKHGINLFVEVKDHSKPPSARQLTPKQKRWHFTWTGARCVVTRVEHVTEIDRQVREAARLCALHGVSLHFTGSTEAMYQPRLS